MGKVVDFLKTAVVFHIATIDGDQPRVRPFSAVIEYGGKPLFCTNNQKDIYKQLQANQKTEISACTAEGNWIRITGEVVFEPSEDAKAAMLAEIPSLQGMYSVGDGKFEVFSLKNAEAKLYVMGKPPELLEF